MATHIFSVSYDKTNFWTTKKFRKLTNMIPESLKWIKNPQNLHFFDVYMKLNICD